MRAQIVVHAGDKKFQSEVEQSLFLQSLAPLLQARVHLLIDVPQGWLISLSCQPSVDEADDVLVITNNPCPEYKLDFAEKFPRARFCGYSVVDIKENLFTLEQTSNPSPEKASSLTPTERLVLQLLAKGHTTRQVAQQRGVSEGRIKNVLQTIYQKLGLGSKVQIPIYYYGLWHILQAGGWEPPHRTRY